MSGTGINPALSVQGSINPMDLQSGEHLIDGQTVQVLLQAQGAQAGLTALAGGGAAGAAQLIAGTNNIATCVTTSDSALLPVAQAGLIVRVINNGASTCRVYPVQANPNNAASAADTIVPLAGSTAAYSDVPANAIVMFYAYAAGYWKASV